MFTQRYQKVRTIWYFTITLLSTRSTWQKRLRNKQKNNIASNEVDTNNKENTWNKIISQNYTKNNILHLLDTRNCIAW